MNVVYIKLRYILTKRGDILEIPLAIFHKKRLNSSCALKFKNLENMRIIIYE